MAGKSLKKVYKQGGELFWQKGYKRNGVFVTGHFKTKPDNNLLNNRKHVLGY